MTLSRQVEISSLPHSVSEQQAIELCYRDHIQSVVHRLSAGYKVLIRCEKGMNAFLFPLLRKRLKRSELEYQVRLIDGRAQGHPDSEEARNTSGRVPEMLKQITEFMRGGISDQEIAFMTHLDVLSTTRTSLSPEGKEVIPLLYEHPRARFCAFVDPSFPLPQSLTDVFDVHVELSGLHRESLPALITQREARALHHLHFDPYALYPYVSGLSALKARRLLSTLTLRPEASPLSLNSGIESLRSLREHTASHIDGVELPRVDLQSDIAGYESLKERVQSELIDLALARHRLTSPSEIELAESLTPKGALFYGPPGTGKTFFAKAIATSLQATLIVVSGPELKSKWVGESEENLRRLFRRARESSPSVIVFDEIDSFAQTRGAYQSSGVEHSMVNQLLTEMDGFRSNEQVFVIGTTNFLSAVDHALLRPGRFELLVEIPAPDQETRELIIRHYQDQLELGLSHPLIKWIAEQTDCPADPLGNPFTADHLKSLCRALKREQLLGQVGEIDERRVLNAIQRDQRPITLTETERRLIATHECGHALISALMPRAKTPSRISIRPDTMSLGRVTQRQQKSRYTYTQSDFDEEIKVLLGGLSAEEICFSEHSVGAAQDLAHASYILREMLTKFGMSPLGLASFMPFEHNQTSLDLYTLSSEQLRAQAEQWVSDYLERAKIEVKRLLNLNIDTLSALTEQLLKQNEITEVELRSLSLHGD